MEWWRIWRIPASLAAWMRRVQRRASTRNWRTCRIQWGPPEREGGSPSSCCRTSGSWPPGKWGWPGRPPDRLCKPRGDPCKRREWRLGGTKSLQLTAGCHLGIENIHLENQWIAYLSVNFPARCAPCLSHVLAKITWSGRESTSLGRTRLSCSSRTFRGWIKKRTWEHSLYDKTKMTPSKLRTSFDWTNFRVGKRAQVV